MRIRESVPADYPSIEALYRLAFPDEDLLPLVGELLRDHENTMSLVAVANTDLGGNIVFTRCRVEAGAARCALLAPLAVVPRYQQHGIGSALVRTGLERLRQAGICVVFVLGDPGYYGRLGFSTERSVSTPCPIPAEWADAWQSQYLEDTAAVSGGRLRLPDVWLDPALWSP